MGERPSVPHHLSNPAAKGTGRQDALRGPTPKPETYRATTPPPMEPVPQVDRHLAAFVEGVVIEQLAAFANTVRLKTETEAMAEYSGKLFKAEETIEAERSKARAATEDAAKAKRTSKATAIGAAGALGSMAAVFLAFWTSFRDTAEIASRAATTRATEVAVDIVEAKAVPIAIATTASDVRVTAVEARMDSLERDVADVQTGITELLMRIPPIATKVRVPKAPR